MGNVLSPFSSEFWDAAGEEIGSEKNWKRAGAEMMSIVTIDTDHLSKEFNNDVDGALADLDNYTLEDFGIDLAIVAASFIGGAAVAKAGGIATRAAMKTAGGKAFARGISNVGAKAAQKATNARAVLALLGSGELKGVEGKSFSDTLYKFFKTSNADGYVMVGGEKVELAPEVRTYATRATKSYEAGLEVSEEEAQRLMGASVKRMQMDMRPIANADVEAALARSAEKQVAETAVKASQKTELEALAEQTLAMLDDVEGKSLSDLELRNAQIDDLISRYSKGEDTFDDIAKAYVKRSNLSPAQVAERKALARAEFDRMATTEGTLLKDAYGVNVNVGKGYQQWKMMADLAVMGASGTAIREALERAIGVPSDRQSKQQLPEGDYDRRQVEDPDDEGTTSVVINPDGTTQSVTPPKGGSQVPEAGGGTGGGTDGGTDGTERSTRPTDEEQGTDTADMRREESADTSTSKESTESFNTKRTIIEHNTDELLEKSLFWSRKVYDDEAEQERNVYRIESPDFPVIVHKDRRRMYIAFRGTDPMKMMNIITDLNTVFGNTSTSGYGQFAGKLYTDAQAVKFHSGFLKSLAGVYQQLLEKIGQYGRDALDDIVVTGHSAGGALASIFTFIYNTDSTILNIRDRLPIHKCITFASPRCLLNTDDAHDIYTKYCPNVTRVWLTEDLVTYLPLHDKLAYDDPDPDFDDELDALFGFIHVGTSFCLDGNRVRNNINVYMTNEIQKSRDVVNDLLGMSDTTQVNELLQLTTSAQFMTYLFNGTIECAKFTQCKELSEFDIRALAKNIQTNSKQLNDYGQKCGLLEPLNLAEYLRTLPLGEDSVDKQDYSIAYAGYYAVKENVKLFTHHDLDTYEERLGFLISRQISTGDNITDPIRQENTERGQTVNDLREDTNESVTLPYVLGIYEGEFKSGDLVEF
jgi:hypothetical protein